MKKFVLLLSMIFPALTLMSQEKTEETPKFGISFGGFVKNDAFFDSRQTVTAREGHFFLWPSAESLDENGDDLNAVPNFNMLAVQSRLSGKITGPDAFGAKTSGVIEGDFFGQANDNINLFRLRHAFIKLNWANTELITGQTWNPLFVTGCFPGTVSFNTGTPFQSFARNPQIRVTQKFGGVSVIAAALSQRDYTSRGPAGTSSSYLRNSVLPDMHLQLHYGTQNSDAGTSYLAGAGIAYKTIVPRTSSSPTDSTTYKVSEKVSGVTAIIFQTVQTKLFTLKIQGRYGENIPDVLSISGIAIKEVVNPVTGELSYTPFKNMTVWFDLASSGKTFQAGIFTGYLVNLGTKDAVSDVNMATNVYGLGTNIESLIRTSGRVIFNSGKFRAALEIEATIANYGSNYDAYYVPASTSSVLNARVLLSTYYFF